MSYYATFDALITLSRAVDMEAIAREAERVFCVRETVIDMVTDTTFDLWFGEYTEYTDDAAWAFLAEIAPHTVSGEIVYQGEDNTWWRHRFDKKKREWLEEEGYMPLTIDELFAKDGVTLEKYKVYYRCDQGDTSIRKD